MVHNVACDTYICNFKGTKLFIRMRVYVYKCADLNTYYQLGVQISTITCAGAGV